MLSDYIFVMCVHITVALQSRSICAEMSATEGILPRQTWEHDETLKGILKASRQGLEVRPSDTVRQKNGSLIPAVEAPTINELDSELL